MDDASASRRRAAWRLIGHLIVNERRGIAGGILSGLAWQAAAITAPFFAAHAIDPLIAGDRGRVYLWAGAAAAVGVIEAIASGGRYAQPWESWRRTGAEPESGERAAAAAS